MTKPEKTIAKPLAVLISDIHYNLNNLVLADKALRQAIDKAAELKVDLIVAGDLHDTKANLRGECVAAMLATFEYAYDLSVRTTLLVGNHDLINEKGKNNSLEFLKGMTDLVKAPLDSALFAKEQSFDVSFIPYQNDPGEFERILSEIPKGSIIICHQGVTGAESGEYIFDKSAVNKEIFEDYRVISGHYHKAQNIKCGRPRKGAIGLFSYIGSPYTTAFSEAKDGPKGFQILYSDGLLEQVPTNLRKHVIYELDTRNVVYAKAHNDEDLVWIKWTGPRLELDKINRQDTCKMFGIKNLKMDSVAIDRPDRKSDKMQKAKKDTEIMDLLIDESEECASDKTALKDLYRKVMS